MDLQRVKQLDKNALRTAIGLVGSGPALDALAGILIRHKLTRYFPHAYIAGWVADAPLSGNNGAASPPPVLRDVPMYASTADMFVACPGLMLVADLSPDCRHMPSLREFSTMGVTLISSGMVERFCSLITEGKLHIRNEDTASKSQQLFALLVDQVKGDMLILDENCTILDVNQQAAHSVEMHASRMIGLNCTELNTISGFCVCEEEHCPYLLAKKTGRQAVLTKSHVTKEGRVRYMENSCYPIPDSTGGSVHYLYIRRDVTDQHHMEQRLQQAEKMAAIGELSTYVAHEIRNPLFAIGGFANALLRNTSLNDLAREKARIIYDESRRLDIILTNILNFARPTEQALGEFDVGAVASQTVDLMTMGSEERCIEVITVIEPGLPKALGNAENLKQCLVNIIKNALEAMPTGGRLRLSAGRDDNFVRIDVTDSGEGIKPEVQDQIFSPFFSTKNSGSGLGLAMTRKVIEDMGGKVSFVSTPSLGTTVTLFIPVSLDLTADFPDQQPYENS